MTQYQECPCDTCDCKDEYNDCYCPLCRTMDDMTEEGSVTGFCQFCGKAAQTYQMGACEKCLEKQWKKWHGLQEKRAKKLDKFIAEAHKEFEEVN